VILAADGDDGGLVEDNTLPADVDQRVGGAEIDGKILREHSGQRSQ
jgi:hypothetical protein